MVSRLSLLLIGLTLLLNGLKAEAVTITSGSFKLTFNEQGVPMSCQLKDDSKELLNVGVAGQGFYFKGWDGAKIPCTKLKQLDAQHLEVATADQRRSAILLVHLGGRSVSWQVQKITGIEVSERYALGFNLKLDAKFKILPLDYMTEAFATNRTVQAECLALGSEPALGGFILYESANAVDEDEVILHLWVEEPLAHPKVKGEWNLATARSWLQAWQKRFAQRTQFVLEAKNPEELQAGLKIAQQAGAQQVYLFTNTWRPDKFWPEKFGNLEVNRNVFPQGEADLAAFAQQVKAQGMYLGVHYISGGIGRSDPQYIGQKPDRRLAGWGSARLVNQVNAQAAGLTIQLQAGTYWPTDSQSWVHGVSAELFPWKYLRVEDEVIRFDRFVMKSPGVYELQGCHRGEGSTLAAEHAVGSEAQGLVMAYGANYVPNNHSSLLGEMAENYAGFINRCGLEHAEFDGAEIHNYDGPWGYRKFSTIVYKNLDHPTTSHDSMGRRPACWFEYLFNSSQKLMAGTCLYSHGNWCIPLELDSSSREASTWLDAQYVLSQGYRGGALGLCKPEPMFGVSPEDLKKHGLTPLFLESLKVWQGIDSQLNDDDRRRMASYFKSPVYRGNVAFNHHVQAEVVPVASALDDHYEITPIRVLRRKEGDTLWQVGQEHGPIGPRQVVCLGESLELDNPEAPQPLAFNFRVLPAFDVKAPEVEADKILNKSPKLMQNIILQPHRPANVSEGSLTKVLVEKDELVLSAENATSQLVRQPEQLPTWGMRADLSHHRAMAVEVEGDGSGALLLVQIGYRDYVIALDFKGTREVVIPHGEVSWYRGDWGWRFPTKHNRYEQVNRLRIGFGELPPSTTCHVKVRHLRALEEIPVVLKDPVISVAKGKMTVKGEISSGNYLTYEGGVTAKVYDVNWNLIQKLPVQADDFISPKGLNTYKVEGGVMAENAKPWLELQFWVKGSPWVVKKP
jgi:hypothetical protein